MYLDKLAWLIENGKIAIKYNQRVCIFCRIDMNFAIAVHNVWKKIESINWVKHQMLKSVHMVIWLLYKACEFKLLKAVICFWQMHTMTSGLWLEVLSDINISIFLSDCLTIHSSELKVKEGYPENDIRLFCFILNRIHWRKKDFL